MAGESTTVLTGNVALPVFSVSTDGGSTFDPIAKLMAPSMPETTVASYPTTNTDITNNFETSLPGWANGGTQTLEFILQEEDYITLLVPLVGIEAQFKTSWTDAAHTTTDSDDTYTGHMTALGKLIPMDGTWTCTATFQVSGKVTNTIGTSV